MPNESPSRPRPVRKELRLLLGALVVFVATLVVTLFALAISILRVDTLSATADALTRQVEGMAATATPQRVTERLEVMLEDGGIARVEVFRGRVLIAWAGGVIPEAEAITRTFPGGSIVFYFEPSATLGGRKATLVIAGLATLAAVAGLLILIVYLPKFFRPVEQMLAEAQRINVRRGADDDARYLVQTFRDAVERVQRQASEIEHLRGATSGRSPDLAEITRTLDRSFQSGLVAIDASGAILSINEPAQQILKIEGGGEMRLEDLADSEFASLVRESFASRSPVNRREVRVSAGGTLVGCTAVPLFDGDVFLGMLVLFVDVTASRAMESRLRDFESLVGLGHMAAGIAHEFRNALFTILGYLRMAQRDVPQEHSEKIRSAEVEAQKLARAVDLLLSFTRPLDLRSQQLRLDELTAGVMETFAKTHEDIRFRTAASEPVEIDGDRELLERALENIVRNAIDAVRENHRDGGGVIEAAVTGSPQPTLVIRDNGPGFDPDKAATYLLPFQSGKAHGTGLGLPLARKIVLHHGGTLTIAGTPGEGAVVRIEFFA